MKFKESLTFKLLILVIIIWIILAIIFGYADLYISIALNVDEFKEIGEFGEMYGDIPGYGLIAVAIVILTASHSKEFKIKRISAYVGIFIGFFIFLLGMLFTSLKTIVFGLGISISLILFFIFFIDKDWSNYRRIALTIVLLSLLCPLLFVQFTKVFTGRVRFMDLSPPDYSGYTPWFLPPGLENVLKRNRSFPSGHAAMSFIFLPLLITVRDKKWNNPKKILLWMLVIGWGCFIAVSRVIHGAHFASDVLFSAGFALVSTIFLYWLIWYKYAEKI